MGILDTLKEMKARYDESVEEKKKREAERIQRERQERERKKREAEEKERMILDKLASGELMQSLLYHCQTISWLGESQGSWDSNRRQFIITPVALIVNNHDTDVMFRCLEEVEAIGGKKFRYSLHREFKPVMDPGGNWIRMPTSETIENDYQMEKYENNDGFQWIAIFFETYGYNTITETDTLRHFAMALRREIAKQYPTGMASEMRKNAYGFWWFEIVVEPKKQKSVL